MDFGCVIDVETTGLDPQKDKIIEVAALEFVVNNDISQPQITSMYSSCEDPEQEISPEIEKLTGINRESIRGQSIDWHTIRQIVEKSSIVIAHNAEFDRQFLRQRKELADISTHWGCSRKHIDWAAKGFRSEALNYLAADHGFINPFAHRALFDCATTFRLITPYLDELIEKSYQREIKILARQAPFEMREKLKRNRYYWNPQEKVWHKTVLEGDLPRERNFLSSEIYPEQDRHEEVTVS